MVAIEVTAPLIYTIVSGVLVLHTCLLFGAIGVVFFTPLLIAGSFVAACGLVAAGGAVLLALMSGVGIAILGPIVAPLLSGG